MIAAVPWTYWLGVGWFAVVAITLVALAVMYVRKVYRLEVTLRQARLFGNGSLPASAGPAAPLGPGRRPGSDA